MVPKINLGPCVYQMCVPKHVQNNTQQWRKKEKEIYFCINLKIPIGCDQLTKSLVRWFSSWLLSGQWLWEITTVSSALCIAASLDHSGEGKRVYRPRKVYCRQRISNVVDGSASRNACCTRAGKEFKSPTQNPVCGQLSHNRIVGGAEIKGMLGLAGCLSVIQQQTQCPPLARRGLFVDRCTYTHLSCLHKYMPQQLQTFPHKFERFLDCNRD